MADDKLDVPQGTLELMILAILARTVFVFRAMARRTGSALLRLGALRNGTFRQR